MRKVICTMDLQIYFTKDDLCSNILQFSIHPFFTPKFSLQQVKYDFKELIPFWALRALVLYSPDECVGQLAFLEKLKAVLNHLDESRVWE